MNTKHNIDKITLSYGSGGRLMHRLIDSLFIKVFENEILRQKMDSALIDIGRGKAAFTTDSYVVNPIFFPGGDIGSLAVYGTVNDLSVCGAKPLYISLGMIIEEGFDIGALRKIAISIGKAAKRSGVMVVTGDTKVVEKGSCDKLFINTSGVGEVYYNGLSAENIGVGDIVIISGTIGEHAVSVLSEREGIEFRTGVKSDSANLNGLIRKALTVTKKVKFMRDPTRGGLATTLNEIIGSGKWGVAIEERSVPVSEGVREACELLGLDPLYLACEGRVLLIVAKEDAKKVLGAMRRDKLGKNAKIIGEVVSEYKGKAYLKTVSGGKRLLDMLPGEQLPRIC